MTEFTRITLENENGTYSIEVRQEQMNLVDTFEDLVVPVLLACGYSQEIIDEYLGDG